MKFSIITVTLNNIENLKRSIESVYKQSYQNIEYIIVDGGSTDNTVEFLEKEKNKRKNLIYISEKDQGIYHAINKGIKLASGDVLTLLHSDDFYYSNEVIANYVKIFSAYSVDIIFSNLIYIKKTDKDNLNELKLIRKWKAYPGQSCLVHNYKKLIKLGWMPPHPTIAIRRELINFFGLYDTNLSISSDYEFILRIFKHDGLKVFYLDNLSYIMTYGGKSNKSIKNILIKSYEDFISLKLHNIDFSFLVLLLKNIRKIHQFFI